MSIHYTDGDTVINHGDCLDVMRGLPDCSVDSVVTDPPYGLEFMGKDWTAPWAQSGINTDAGFSGGGVSATRNAPSFTSSTNPNCLNCGGKQRGRRDGTALVAVCTCDAPRFPNNRAIEMRAFGEWCEQWATECLRVLKPGGYLLAFGGSRTWHRLACAVEDAGFEIRDSIFWLYGSGFPKSLNVGAAIMSRAGLSAADDEWTPEAEQWRGFGTALKPSAEPVVCGRKPLGAGTVAANVLKHGTGALNIDACRVATADVLTESGAPPLQYGGANARPFHANAEPRGVTQNDAGRWPTNVVLDGSQADELGEPSRFFPTFRYQAKAPTRERPKVDGVAHPTVKPLELMRWLVKLVTPPGGVVLEPFAGSGTTVEACQVEEFKVIAIERDESYIPLIMSRLRPPWERGAA